MHPEVHRVVEIVAVTLQVFSVVVLGAAVLISSLWFMIQGV
jgi:hypothetical protein